jgi:hypothetical protein
MIFDTSQAMDQLNVKDLDKVRLCNPPEAVVYFFSSLLTICVVEVLSYPSSSSSITFFLAHFYF